MYSCFSLNVDNNRLLETANDHVKMQASTKKQSKKADSIQNLLMTSTSSLL